MKPFGVAGVKNGRLMDFGFLSRRQLQDLGVPDAHGIGYHEDPTQKEWNQEHLDSSVRLYWTNTRGDANLLAQELAAKFSGIHWVVFESKQMSHSMPGKPKNSLFTPQGIVPA